MNKNFERVRALYESGLSSNEVSLRLGHEKSWAYKVLSKAGYKLRSYSDSHRTHKINSSFFHDLDDEVKAYWFGFLMADGNVCGNMLQVALKLSDADHLRRLAQDLQSDYVVTEVNHAPKVNGIKRKYARLAFCNVEMVVDLKRNGLGPCKTGVADWWRGPPHLMRHFWRGCVDGDGSLYGYIENKTIRLELVGTKDMCTGFSNWALENLKVKMTVWPGHGNCWRGRTTSYSGSLALAAELYRDCEVALNRKLSIARIWGEGQSFK